MVILLPLAGALVCFLWPRRSVSLGLVSALGVVTCVTGLCWQVVEQGVAEKLIRSDIPALLVAHTLWVTVLSVIQFVSVETRLFEMLELSPAKIFESHFELVLNGIRS